MIICDCQSVVDLVNKRMDGDRTRHDENTDLWDDIDAAIDAADTHAHAISWIRGHIDLEQAESIEEAGGSSANALEGTTGLTQLGCPEPRARR